MNPITDQLNRPIHDLRVSVIDRCNFRCTYCMPDKETHDHTFLDNNEWLTFDEIFRLVKLFVQLGTKKVRLTGGEPLLRPNLVNLIKDLSTIPEIEDLALTTNGSSLKEHAAQIKAAGLHRLTVSLDTLDSRVFKTITGNRGSINHVLEGIEEAQRVGFESMKINVVVQKGVNDRCIMDMVEYFRNTNHVLRFIEFMDVGNCNHWESQYVVPSKNIVSLINDQYPIKPVNSNYFGEVASRYKYTDGAGEIGFISSVSQPFCGSCTRARLSADGQIITCLFADHGQDIRQLIRSGGSDQELLEAIKMTWETREDRYSELRHQNLKTPKTSNRIEMFEIGG